MPDSLDGKLDAIARQPFRAKFHLRGRLDAFAGPPPPGATASNASPVLHWPSTAKRS
jgi:hypothetical protein